MVSSVRAYIRCGLMAVPGVGACGVLLREIGHAWSAWCSVPCTPGHVRCLVMACAWPTISTSLPAHPTAPRPPRSALNKAIAYVAARKQISAIRKAVRESMDSMDDADAPASGTAGAAPARQPAVAKAGRKATAAKAPSTRGRRSGGSSSRELVARAKKADASS